jgi:hypothetical protein
MINKGFKLVDRIEQITEAQLLFMILIENEQHSNSNSTNKYTIDNNMSINDIKAAFGRWKQ